MAAAIFPAAFLAAAKALKAAPTPMIARLVLKHAELRNAPVEGLDSTREVTVKETLAVSQKKTLAALPPSLPLSHRHALQTCPVCVLVTEEAVIVAPTAEVEAGEAVS